VVLSGISGRQRRLGRPIKRSLKKGIKMTHNEIILDYLRNNRNGLTCEEAPIILGIVNFTPRMSDLKDAGHEFYESYEEGRHGKKIMRYKYKGFNSQIKIKFGRPENKYKTAYELLDTAIIKLIPFLDEHLLCTEKIQDKLIEAQNIIKNRQ
jgi:hypothetical protein